MLSGTLSFDKVPSTTAGLNFGAIVQRPLRGVEVQIVEVANLNNVLASGVTGSNGHYGLSWPLTGPSSVKVVFLARTSGPIVAVQDNVCA